MLLGNGYRNLMLYGSWKKAKGKQVKILHDLVTVIRESAANTSLGIAWEDSGRCGSLSQETCLLSGTGVRLRTTRNWLYRRYLLKNGGILCDTVLYAKEFRLCFSFPCEWLCFLQALLQYPSAPESLLPEAW